MHSHLTPSHLPSPPVTHSPCRPFGLTLYGLLLMPFNFSSLKHTYLRGKAKMAPFQEARHFSLVTPENPFYLGCHLSMLILISVLSGAGPLTKEIDEKDLMIPFFPCAFKRHHLSLINFSRRNPCCFEL